MQFYNSSDSKRVGFLARFLRFCIRPISILQRLAIAAPGRRLRAINVRFKILAFQLDIAVY